MRKDNQCNLEHIPTSLQIQSQHAENIDNAELKSFIQAHIPEARLKEAQRGDLVYSLPPFSSSNASSYRSLLTALDANLDALQLGGYGISDTTLEEVSAHTATRTLSLYCRLVCMSLFKYRKFRVYCRHVSVLACQVERFRNSLD